MVGVASSLGRPSMVPLKIMLIIIVLLVAILISVVSSFPSSSLIRQDTGPTTLSGALVYNPTTQYRRIRNHQSSSVFGTSVFASAGSTSITQEDTARIASRKSPKKKANRRQDETHQQYLEEQGGHLLRSYEGSPREQELLSAAIEFLLGYSEKDATIQHSLGVASILANELKLDAASVVAGMLQHHHQSTTTMDDNAVVERIKSKFGLEIASLVAGVTEIDIALSSYHHHDQKPPSSSSGVLQEERERENYRKLILAMAKDIRVVLIKLADATQTLRMMDDEDNNNHHLFQEKGGENDEHQHHQQQQQSKENRMIAKETLDLYAPLAHRLGMYTMKTELEDTSLKHWKPKDFRHLKVMVSARQIERKQYTNKVIGLLEEKLQQGGINPSKYSSSSTSSSSPSSVVTGRAKSFYSIYQKMQKKKLAFDDLHDLMAFRILVEDVSQCYQALGIVHANWKPVKGRFKDYIALPKSNGYQSLHTTVIGPQNNKKMEVQIRTHEMHRIAEGGVAAHWMYKDSNKGSSKGTAASDDAQRYKWLRQLVLWAQQEQDDDDDGRNNNDDQAIAASTTNVKAAEKGDHLTNNDNNNAVSEKEVFVFSPRGQLFSLTKGSTVLDFAYRVHTQVGNNCVGAKVNGKMVPLKYTVSNGDTIEILQSSNQKPNQEWLKIVQTSKAKARIKSWLRRQQMGTDEENITLGRDMLEKGLRQYHPQGSSRNRNAMDCMAEYKKRLPHLLSTFKVNNEQRLLASLAHGQISVASVLQEVFVVPPQNRAVTKNQEDEEAVQQWGSIQESSTTVRSSSSSSSSSSSRTRPSTSSTQQADGVVVGGKRNILISFCRNCNPLYGEQVQGVVTQGRGVKVHRLDCRYLVESDSARRVDAVWDETAKTTKRSLVVEVLCEDVPGVLAGMSKAITVAEVNIGGAVLKRLSNGQGLARFELILSTIEDLERVTLQLQREPGVINVRRR